MDASGTVELDSFEWNLNECNYALSEAEFEADIHVGSAARLTYKKKGVIHRL